jgi:hypothetical protein
MSYLESMAVRHGALVGETAALRVINATPHFEEEI